jgi:hypothetical protein
MAPRISTVLSNMVNRLTTTGCKQRIKTGQLCKTCPQDYPTRLEVFHPPDIQKYNPPPALLPGESEEILKGSRELEIGHLESTSRRDRLVVCFTYLKKKIRCVAGTE